MDEQLSLPARLSIMQFLIPVRCLRKKKGFKVIYMPVDEDGRVDIEELERVIENF